MATDYAVVGVFLIVGLLFVVVNVDVISRLLRPTNPQREKLTTYECGEDPVGASWIRVHVRYYLYALVYVIFAVETIYLLPWAVVFRKLGMFAFLEMMLFIAILLVGFSYAWRKGALEWV